MNLTRYFRIVSKTASWTILFSCVVGIRISAQEKSYDIQPLDISKIESVVSLFDYCLFYVDHPPFQELRNVPLDSFKNFSNNQLQEAWRDGINTRFWVRFGIENTSDTAIGDRKLYLGNASRIFLYELKNDSIHLFEKKGSNYTQGRSIDGVSDRVFPLSVVPKDTVFYLAHISSTFIPSAHEYIDPKIIRRGYESVIEGDTRNMQRIGLAYMAALSIILLLLLFSIIVYVLKPERPVAAFGLLCFSFILYYARDMDYFLWAVDIYPSYDEIITRTEPLFRAFINGGFLFFTFSYFKIFSYRSIFKVTSIFVFSFGILSGLWFLFFNRISPYQEFTTIDTSVYIGYLLLSQLNDLFLLIFLWRSRKDYSRFYVLGTALYLILNYGGLFKDALFPEFLKVPYFGHYCFLIGAVLFTMSIGFLLIRRAQAKEVELLVQMNKSAQLEELNKMKSEFYTNVGHEFKTPLSLIKAPIDLELNEHSHGSKSRSRLEMVQRNTDRLISLVSDLTDYTRTEHQLEPLIIVKNDAQKHFSYLFSNFESLAITQKKAFSYAIDLGDLEYWYDRNIIETVVYNLMSNAFKFTKEGDRITTEVRNLDGSLFFMIRDSGIGIKKHDLDKIFDRFYRADYHQEIEGLGVGLAFVKELLTRHQGSIEVESKYGKGTIIRVQIPMDKPLSNSEEEDQLLMTKINTENNSFNYSTTDNLSIILIVEDNQDMRQHLSELFQESFEVVTAQNGKQGIEKALAVMPDIILTDMMMPIMGGDKMCQSIKNNETLSHIPILMLTANPTESDKIKMLEYGVGDYILKPFNNQEIILKIRNQILFIEEVQKRFGSMTIPVLAKTALNKGDNKFWLRIEEVLKEHLFEANFSVEEFSKSMLMSRMQLHRKLKAITGLSASGFLRGKRIEASVDLLRDGNLTISEIAYETGFSSPSYFSKCFKEKYGISPAEFS